jgi:hypothetical protein
MSFFYFVEHIFAIKNVNSIKLNSFFSIFEVNKRLQISIEIINIDILILNCLTTY